MPAQELRTAVAMTIGTLMCCDLFLNPNPKPDVAAAVAGVLNFISSKLGLTKADIQSVSAACLAWFVNVGFPKLI